MISAKSPEKEAMIPVIILTTFLTVSLKVLFALVIRPSICRGSGALSGLTVLRIQSTRSRLFIPGAQSPLVLAAKAMGESNESPNPRNNAIYTMVFMCRD